MTDSENPPAFPSDGYHTSEKGMSLRDWFAGQALTGLLASGKWDNCGEGFENYITGHALNLADAMLTNRARGTS